MKQLLVIISILMSLAVFAGQRDFNKLDKDNDGQLSLPEFLLYVGNVERMTKVFNNRDKNKDGFLSPKEYKLKPTKKKS